MKKIIFTGIIAILLIVLSSCHNSSNSILDNLADNNYNYKTSGEKSYDETITESSYESVYDNAEKTTTYDYAPSGTESNFEEDVSDIRHVKIPDKIIKTASLSVELKDYKKALKQIKNAVNKWNGYISSENENEYGYMISNLITIRVESSNFEGLVNDITQPAYKIASKSISAQDVSEEFVDIEARLKTKKEVEQRYIDLLNKANSIQDILYIEDKIRVIREEIEAKEGRLKYLKDQVSYSTINLDLKEYFEQDVNEPGFFEKGGHALGSGWDGFLAFIIALLYLWPLWLITGGGLYLLLKILNRKKRKQKDNS